MSTARDEILARVRAAAGAGGAAGAGPGSVARSYRRTGTRSQAERVSLFCERVGDYRADVRRLATSQIAATVAAICRERDAGRLVIPGRLPVDWRPEELHLVEDSGLTASELDAFDGVLTGCTVAIAETGTIVLDGSPDQGRRAITLVPDYHLCIVRADQVVELVPEALGRLDPRPGRSLTWISGPSATSDIELSRVEGVHGPRTLEVILVEPG